MTPPHRRWSFSLRTMLLGLTLAAVTMLLVHQWFPSDPSIVNVAEICGDEGTTKAVKSELAIHGIDAGFEGSVVYGVFVEERDAVAAKRVLRNARHIPGLIRVLP